MVIKKALITVFVVCFIGMLTGCLKDDLLACPEDYELHLKVVDLVSGADLTTSGEVEHVYLYIFDMDGRFIEYAPLSANDIRQRIPVTIKRSKSENIRIYAWGNLKDSQDVTEPVPGNLSESMQIVLKTNDEGYALCPDNLFFGEKVVSFSRQSRIQRAEIPVYHKNACMMITVRGLEEISDASQYYFKVDKKYNGYDFTGKPLESPVSIKQAGKINNTNDDFVTADAFNLIHHMDGDEGVTISLYNQTTGKAVFTIDRTADGESIVPRSGRMTNVLIDLRSQATVHIETTAWDEVYHWEIW